MILQLIRVLDANKRAENAFMADLLPLPDVLKRFIGPACPAGQCQLDRCVQICRR